MIVEPGNPAITLAVALLRRHSTVQYIRLRAFPSVPKARPHSTPPTLERALRHKRGPEVLWAVPTDLTVTGFRAELTQIIDHQNIIGLCSRMEMRNGTSKQALLMDFLCEKSTASLQNLKDACQRIGYAGWLLESHSSYHFYGDDLVDESEWLSFMGRWLLLERLSDVRFIGHCIIERISCLRLTGDQAWSEPRVAARVDMAVGE